MKIIKDIAFFLIISALIIIGVLFFLKKETDIIRDEMKQETSNIDTVEVYQTKKIEKKGKIEIEDKNIVLNPLDIKIDLKCSKGEKVIDILKRIEDSNEIVLNYNKSDMDFENDLGMHIYDISLKEVFEILLGEDFFWYNKRDNIIYILRK